MDLHGSGIKETRAVSGQADHGSPDLPPVLPRNWAKGLAKSGTGYNNMGGPPPVETRPSSLR